MDKIDKIVKTYACIPDTHGGSKALLDGLACIDDWHISRDLPIYGCTKIFLGDYIDRGSDPNGVLELVKKCVDEGAIAVIGNHDDLFLGTIDDEDITMDGKTAKKQYLWEINGGIETLSLMYPELNINWFDLDVHRDYIKASWQYQFLKSLPVTHTVNGIFICHAPQSSKDSDRINYLWGRKNDYKTETKFLVPFNNQCSVHGHIGRFIGRKEIGGRPSVFPDIRHFVHGGVTRIVCLCDTWSGNSGAWCKPVILSVRACKTVEIEAVI